MTARDPGLDLDPPPVDTGTGHAARLADVCTMLPGDPPRTCHACETPLPLTRSGRPHKGRRWCSEECSRSWARNHVWAVARDAAVSRDGGRCVRTDRHEDEETVRADLAAQAEELRAELDEYHRREISDHDYDLWRDLLRRRRALDAELQERIGTRDLEVNHREPRNGDGYGVGCWHHLDNLETLCHGCHVEETTRQRRGLPTWRDDPRTIDEIEGRGRQDRLDL